MKQILIGLSCFLLTGCASYSKASESSPRAAVSAAGVRQAGAEVLFWSQDQRDRNFRQMEKLFPSHVVRASSRPKPLPNGQSLEEALGGNLAIDQLISQRNIAGLLVLQNGKVRMERYARGFGPEQRWTSFSVAKSITSTLVGAAVKDGYIKTLDDPVIRYIPELAGSAYDGVSVRQVLTMTSGVRWNEDYSNPRSDVARMLTEPTPPGQDVTVAYLRNLQREAPPGTKWAYKTGETNLIGVLVKRATGKPLSRYLSEKIWRPYGMEMNAYWQIDTGGQEIGGCCLSATLRDYGRMGQFLLDGGQARGQPVVPSSWIADATSVQQKLGGSAGYGYQWWTSTNGTYSALGIFGQMIHIDPARRLVIVTASAWPQATGKELSASRGTLIEKITATTSLPSQ